MNIAIDIRSTLKKQTGIGRYTLNLINSLAKIDPKNSYFLYSRKKLLDFKRRLPELPAKNFRHCVDYFKKGPDRVLPEIEVFHTSSYGINRPLKAKRFVVTVHGVIIKTYPLGFQKNTIQEIDAGMRNILPQADVIVADSYSTKTDLMKFYGVHDAKIKVIYPGVAERAPYPCGIGRSPALLALSKRAGRSPAQNYILFVGTIEPRKNIQGLIKAFNYLKKNLVGAVSNRPLRLYIVGMKGWMYEDIFKEYEDSEFKKDIIFKGYVNDQELAELYKNASVFVYPSFYEGFGFPILEAFSYGVPVITSKTSSCGEIAGDGALLINPENYEEIGEAISKVISDETLRQELIKKGFERVKEFTWEKTAKEFLKLFGVAERA